MGRDDRDGCAHGGGVVCDPALNARQNRPEIKIALQTYNGTQRAEVSGLRPAGWDTGALWEPTTMAMSYSTVLKGTLSLDSVILARSAPSTAIWTTNPEKTRLR